MLRKHCKKCIIRYACIYCKSKHAICVIYVVCVKEILKRLEKCIWASSSCYLKLLGLYFFYTYVKLSNCYSKK